LKLQGCGSNLTAGHLQATLSKCKPNVCSGQLNLLPSAGWERSSSLQTTRWDWGGGMSLSCTAGPNFVDAGNRWLHNTLGVIISSCQSADISEIAKNASSHESNYVSSAVSSTRLHIYIFCNTDSFQTWRTITRINSSLPEIIFRFSKIQKPYFWGMA